MPQRRESVVFNGSVHFLRKGVHEHHLEIPIPIYLIPDSGFSAGRFLRKPYQKAPYAPIEDRIFNIRLGAARKVVERGFESADEEYHNERLLEDEVRNELHDSEGVNIDGQAPMPAEVRDFVRRRVQTPVVIEFIDLTGDETIPPSKPSQESVVYVTRNDTHETKMPDTVDPGMEFFV
ncbi:hypothetical protein QAD02_000903 [Eretmocerus hayati]|uniref:Uncharacterized protein n=1 Tax=Eretmocerus hayati TaxID=131215 RepID=A0ACC2NEX5_9HYME|nr:hypothetical protein QAD02_000903 [Eretmocerus hayati]